VTPPGGKGDAVQLLALADYDGDGRADLVLRTVHGATRDTVTVHPAPRRARPRAPRSPSPRPTCCRADRPGPLTSYGAEAARLAGPGAVAPRNLTRRASAT
ncbi:hypothetical protein SF12_19420, partial [Streptomyces sp. MBRL 601]